MTSAGKLKFRGQQRRNGRTAAGCARGKGIDGVRLAPNPSDGQPRFQSNSVYFVMSDQVVVKFERLWRDMAQFLSLPIPKPYFLMTEASGKGTALLPLPPQIEDVSAASDPTVASRAGAGWLLRTEPQVRLTNLLSISNHHSNHFISRVQNPTQDSWCSVSEVLGHVKFNRRMPAKTCHSTSVVAK